MIKWQIKQSKQVKAGVKHKKTSAVSLRKNASNLQIFVSGESRLRKTVQEKSKLLIDVDATLFLNLYITSSDILVIMQYLKKKIK